MLRRSSRDPQGRLRRGRLPRPGRLGDLESGPLACCDLALHLRACPARRDGGPGAGRAIDLGRLHAATARSSAWACVDRCGDSARPGTQDLAGDVGGDLRSRDAEERGKVGEPRPLGAEARSQDRHPGESIGGDPVGGQIDRGAEHEPCGTGQCRNLCGESTGDGAPVGAHGRLGRHGLGVRSRRHDDHALAVRRGELENARERSEALVRVGRHGVDFERRSR